jgi:hypothetical protein
MSGVLRRVFAAHPKEILERSTSRKAANRLLYRLPLRPPLRPLVIGALSRAPEVLDVERAFTNRQLAAGARMLEAAQRNGFVPDHIAPHLTIALMIGGIRQALIGVLMSEERPDPEKLTDEIWAFMAGALRLTAGSGIEKNGRDKVA